MRAGIVVEVTPEDRVRLERIVGDRNTPQKHSARARVILATAEDCGTLEIVRRSGGASEQRPGASHKRGVNLRSFRGDQYYPA